MCSGVLGPLSFRLAVAREIVISALNKSISALNKRNHLLEKKM